MNIYIRNLQRAVLDLTELAIEHDLGDNGIVRSAKELIRCSVQDCGNGGACNGEGTRDYPCPLKKP